MTLFTNIYTSVNIVTGYRVSIPGRDRDFFFATATWAALGRETDHSLPFSVKVKNT